VGKGRVDEISKSPPDFFKRALLLQVKMSLGISVLTLPLNSHAKWACVRSSSTAPTSQNRLRHSLLILVLEGDGGVGFHCFSRFKLTISAKYLVTALAAFLATIISIKDLVAVFLL
jgi:hypothetical protein